MPTRDLHVTSPLLRGPDVLAVQRRLAALGYEPGPLDGVYGPATAAAVTAFQRAAGIAVDGIVGLETRKALAAARAPTSDPHAGGGSAIGRKALAEARKHVGTTEVPPGSNRTPFGDLHNSSIRAKLCLEAPGVYGTGGDKEGTT